MVSRRLRYTREKPFTCDLCKSSFLQKGNLNTHTEHHPMIRRGWLDRTISAFALSFLVKDIINSNSVTCVRVLFYFHMGLL